MAYSPHSLLCGNLECPQCYSKWVPRYWDQAQIDDYGKTFVIKREDLMSYASGKKTAAKPQGAFMLHEVAMIEVSPSVVGDTAKGILGKPAEPTGRFAIENVIASNPEMAKVKAQQTADFRAILSTLGDNEVILKVRTF